MSDMILFIVSMTDLVAPPVHPMPPSGSQERRSERLPPRHVGAGCQIGQNSPEQAHNAIGAMRCHNAELDHPTGQAVTSRPFLKQCGLEPFRRVR
jgi:hypothetical protein